VKITDVQAIPVGIPLGEKLRWGKMAVATKGGILVRVDTDEDVFGLGEAGISAEYYPTVGAIIRRQLLPLLVGKDPRDISALWLLMFDATHMWGRRGVETYAMSGVDIALWDLLGKLSGQPVYRLLGAAKSSVRAYFAPSLKPKRQILEEVLKAVYEDGYKAMKLRIGRDPQEGIGLVSEVRDGINNDAEIMVDANMAYDRYRALEVAGKLRELDVRWFEEPIASHSLTQYAEEHDWLAGRTDLPLAGGESLLTRYEFPHLLAHRTFEVVQPDCTSVGGISEAKRIADMASAWNLNCVPHISCASGTGVSLAAGLHVVLACTNSPYVELDAYGGAGWDGLVRNPLMALDGYLSSNEEPGLGVELDDSVLERFSLLHHHS